MNKLNIVHALGNDVLFVDNLREVDNLSTLRMEYNTITYCQSGHILIDVGGNNQVKVGPGQLLMIPTGKLVQPMFISTDVVAGALLVSDRVLRSVLGSQVDIWNKAIYMKEIYVVEEVGWLDNFQHYARSTFDKNRTPFLRNEITISFLRTMILMICDELLQYDGMDSTKDNSSIHEKVIFNQFLQLIAQQRQKRQRVAFYAEQLNITSKYLSTVSKKVSGKTPLRWITESVMQDCYQLLSDSNLTVKEISHRLGFPNSSFFGQFFRNEAGVTPVTYRKKHKRIS